MKNKYKIILFIMLFFVALPFSAKADNYNSVNVSTNILQSASGFNIDRIDIYFYDGSNSLVSYTLRKENSFGASIPEVSKGDLKFYYGICTFTDGNPDKFGKLKVSGIFGDEYNNNRSLRITISASDFIKERNGSSISGSNSSSNNNSSTNSTTVTTSTTSKVSEENTSEEQRAIIDENGNLIIETTTSTTTTTTIISDKNKNSGSGLLGDDSSFNKFYLILIIILIIVISLIVFIWIKIKNGNKFV